MTRPRPKRASSSSAADDADDIIAASNAVFRRDAGKTDYLVIPLYAGVIARCMLARGVADAGDADPVEHQAAVDHARRVVDLAAAGDADPASWENDTESYGVVAELLFRHQAATLFFASISYAYRSIDLPFADARGRRIPALLAWLGATPTPTFTEAVLVSACIAMMETSERGKELAVLARDTRRIRVALADRLRREGLTTWPRVLAAAVNDWTVPTLEHLAHGLALTGDAFLHQTAEQEPEMRRAGEKLADDTRRLIESVRAEAARRAESAEEKGRADAERIVGDAVGEIEQARDTALRATAERDRFADRLARAQSRIEHLESELAAAGRAREAAESEALRLRRERQEWLESAAADEAVATPATILPIDAFAGRRILVFTGAESAAARSAMQEAFAAFGAEQVDVYQADRSRGPEIISPDALFAIDVSFMAHTTWEAIRDRARRAGAWVYTGRHGSATIARATAAAWLAHHRPNDETAPIPKDQGRP